MKKLLALSALALVYVAAAYGATVVFEEHTFSKTYTDRVTVSSKGKQQVYTVTGTVAGTITDADTYPDPVTVTQTVTGPTDPPPPPPDPTAPALQQPDGGVNYYGQFQPSLPSDPSYFPIGVWGAYNMYDANNRNLDAQAGINLYVWMPNAGDINPVVSDGRFHIIQNYDAPDTLASVATGLGDEIDMVQANEQGAAEARAVLTQRRAANPDDAYYMNYGKGVAFWNSDSDAEQYVNDFQELVSADVYWFTDPGGACSQWEGGVMFTGGTRALTQAECRRASNYGAVVERLRYLDGLDGQRKPIWNFVEISSPFSNGGTITGPQFRAAVWHSLIAGARGIIYFQHDFLNDANGVNHNSLRTSPNRPTVISTAAQVKTLAPVLNSPNVVSGWTASADVKAMMKWDGTSLYLFAGSTNNVASMAQFSMPCVGDTVATVVGENRDIAVTGGSFSDQFADGNAVHIYRIDKTCGLT